MTSPLGISALLALVVGGCVYDNTVVCGDLRCPAGSVCTSTGCANAADAAACDGKAEGDPCSSMNVASGGCTNGVCEPFIVSGTYIVRTVQNGPTFEPERREIVPAANELVLTAYLDDGTRADVDYDPETGTFSFVRNAADQRYRLITAAFGETTEELQHDASQLSIGVAFAGRIEASPLVRSEVAFNYPMAPVRTAHVVSTGVYTQTDTGLVGPIIELDWRLANSTSAYGTRMLDADAFDRIYAFEPETVTAQGNSPPWTRYRTASSASISQAAGTIAMLPAPQVVAPNTCAHLVVNGTAEHLRLKSSHPRSYFQEGHNWLMYAVPAIEHTGLSGLLVTASCGVSTPTTTNFDFDITPAFYDPFMGMTLVASSSALASFYVQVPPADATTVTNSTTMRIPIDRGAPGACGAVGTIEPAIAIPGNFRLEGNALSFDNQLIAVDTSPTLEWESVTDGVVDFWAVVVLEVDAINNKTTLVSRWSATTAHPTARLEPKYLVPGHSYILAITAGTGRPNLRNGDLRTQTLPSESATIYSHVFTVAQ